MLKSSTSTYSDAKGFWRWRYENESFSLVSKKVYLNEANARISLNQWVVKFLGGKLRNFDSKLSIENHENKKFTWRYSNQMVKIMSRKTYETKSGAKKGARSFIKSIHDQSFHYEEIYLSL